LQWVVQIPLGLGIAPALPYYTPSLALKAPTSRELTQRARTIAHRVGRYLDRQGLLERDAENSYLAGDAVTGCSPKAPAFGAPNSQHRALVTPAGSRLAGRLGRGG